MRQTWLPPLVCVVFALALLYFCSSHAEAHDFYARQFSPTKDGFGVSRGCCNNVDCAPRQTRFNAVTGQLEIELRGQWWPAMDQRWYLGEAPDGGAHGCMMPSDQVPRCVWVGFGA